MSFPHVPFDSVFSDESGGNLKTPQSEYSSQGRYPIIDQGRDLIGGYTDDPERLCGGGAPAIVFGDHTRIVKYAGFPFCMGADGVKVLRPKIEADLKYLYYYLRSLDVPSAGYDRHFKYLKRMEVVVPPLPEQRRIAAILDQADALRAKRREALAQLDQLTQAVFVEMFGDPLVNPKRGPRLPLERLGTVVTGNTPSRDDPHNFGNAIEWIKSDNLNTPYYHVTRAAEGLSEAGRRKARTAPASSILVTCIAGSPDCIGNCAMTDREVAFNQQINAFLPRVGDPHYYFALFKAGKKLIQSASTNGMKGMVSKGRFEQICVMSPPPKLQSAFAERALAVVAQTDKNRDSQKKLDALFASLQHRAFTGQLS